MVVNCGGMFAAEIGRLAGVRVPVIPIEHQYVVTEPFRSRGDPPLPTLRDPDLLVYFRQEVDGLVMGGYERDPAPWTATEQRYDAIPPDFNGKLLAEDWPRFEQIAANAQRRVPVMGDVGVRRMINGPEAFTPDNEFCLGETEVAGLFVAAGFCAHGIAGAGGIGKVHGRVDRRGRTVAGRLAHGHQSLRPPVPVAVATRSSAPPRPTGRTTTSRFPACSASRGAALRRSPAYAWHRAHGAVFGEKSGWERVDYYESNAADGRRVAAADGLDGAALVARDRRRASRHARVRRPVRRVVLRQDRGERAARRPSFLEWVCDNRVARGDRRRHLYPGAEPRAAASSADFTVTRLADDVFLIVTGTAFGTHDMAWLRSQARRRDADVRIADVTGAVLLLRAVGAASREHPVAADAGRSEQRRVPVHDRAGADRRRRAGAGTARDLRRRAGLGALRVERVRRRAVGDALGGRARDDGLVAGGYRAIDSMRVEKGYRVWGSDLTAETTPYEAGLGFCVKLDKPGGFEGRDALVAAKAAGLTRRLRAIVLDDPTRRRRRQRAGADRRPRSSGGSPRAATDTRSGASIAYAYLPIEAGPGNRGAIDLFGDGSAATVAAEPLFDPRGAPGTGLT